MAGFFIALAGNVDQSDFPRAGVWCAGGQKGERTLERTTFSKWMDEQAHTYQRE